MTKIKRETYLWYILSGVIILAPVVGYPLVEFFRLSFSKWVLEESTAYFNSGRNFLEIFRDPLVWNSLKLTAIFTGLALLCEHVLGFGLALLLKRTSLSKILPLYAIPMFFPPLAAVVVWLNMFNPQFGVVNYLLTFFGISPQAWVFSFKLAIPSLIIVDAWQWAPFPMLIFTAGLTTIPQRVYEAARINGASSWYIFRRITLPLIKPFLLISILYRLIYLLTTFDLIAAMTEGGPGDATLTIYYLIWRNTFQFVKVGYGASISLLVLIATIVICTVLINATKSKEA